MTPRNPIPLRPDYSAARTRAATPFIRDAAALLLSRQLGKPLEEVATQFWPADDGLVRRAATSSATTTDAVWGGVLTGMGSADVISILAPASASAAILDSGLRFSFAGVNVVRVPNIKANTSGAAFLGEGLSLPVLAYDTSAGTLLTPRKLGLLSAFTRKISQFSVPAVEMLVRATIGEDLAASLDTLLLDATAGDGVRPAGLRYNIAAATASVATSPDAAMLEDVGTLLGSVTAVAKNAPILVIAAPAQAAMLRMWRENLPFQVLASGGLSDGTVVALASNAFVCAGDRAPRIELGNDAMVIMDTAPAADLGAALDADPVQGVKSIFQCDLLALKMVFEISYALRDPAGLCWLENVLW